MAKEVMSVKEVAEYLDFSETKIYRMIDKKEIPFAKIGGQYRFIKSAIDQWLLDQIQAGKVGRLADTERRGELERIKESKDPLTRRLLLVGLLTRALEAKDIKPVIVGGQAVEFYTAGGYATGDIDIVSPGLEEIAKVLTELGFTKEGRHWFSEELNILIEVPSSALTATQYEKITTVEIDELRVYLIGIEDLIIDRLNVFVHWKSGDDRIWAKELMLLYKDQVDWEYLEKRASQEEISRAVKELKKEVM